MRNMLLICLLAFLAGCVSPDAGRQKSGLLAPLQTYVDGVAGSLDQVPEQRRAELGKIAETIVRRLNEGEEATLTFICTHNSRRSHMSQIWAQTAAYHYGLEKVSAYSGGTEVTACNCRTITAMRSAGFAIKDATAGDNPLYLVSYAGDRPPIRAYSKLYNVDSNPKKGFIALMTCSSADKSCPVVQGSIARYAIHYVDPRLCDDTPTETTAYNERCLEIAREMFFIMSQVKRKTTPIEIGKASGN